MAVTDVFMPLMGEGVTEAILVKWLKKPGETVRENEPLFEVSTDKVDTEIPAPASGILMKTLAGEGATIAVNTVIAQISDAAAQPVSETTQPQPRKAAPPAAPAQTVRSSPLVRKIAADFHIDLRSVDGSGLGGRITKNDLEPFLKAPAVATATTTSRPTIVPVPVQADRARLVPPPTWESSSRLKTALADGGGETLEGVPVVREKMTRMRSLIAHHMVESVRVSPHVTTVFEMDLHKVVTIREKHKDSFEAREGFKLTYTPFFIHAAIEAIKAHPIVNTSVDGEDILFKKDINVGCAVAIENGLIVPVIKKAGELSLLGIARRLNDLVTRARTKKLLPDDVQGGTFSITNPGGFGSLTSNPIINQPQVAILGIGTIVKRPVVLPGDAIGIRPMIMMSLTFDHRVVDGEQGSKFLATMKQVLESFETLPQ